ncbi:MAG: hypothetical protein V1692_00420 [bacterium]
MAMFFVVLFLNKQLAENGDNLNNPATGVNQAPATSGAPNQPAKPAEAIEQQVQKIIEQAEQNQAASNPAEVRQEIIGTINAEIIKQEQTKTPEQKAADLKAQAERQKIIDQINSQIKKK